MKTALILLAALIFASSTAAAGGSWTSSNMATATRAVSYPKSGSRTLTCRGKTTFRCVATYRHHHRLVFHAQWQGLSGWICAGAKASTCKTLHHGFVPTSQTSQGLGGPAELAAVGYMADHGIPQPVVSKPCAATSKSVWSCGYNNMTVTIMFKQAKGGYVTTASAS